MSYRIAAATSNGKIVDTHFGRAEYFTILEVQDDGSFSEIERRDVFHSSDGKCSQDLMNKAAENLSDCSYVLAAKIGPHAIQALEAKKISAFDIAIEIAPAVEKIHVYHKKVNRIN